MTESNDQITEQKLDTTAGSSFALRVALIFSLLALTVVVWQWINTRHRITGLEQTLALRLDQNAVSNQQSQAVSKLADERSQEAIAKVTLLEQKVADFQNQQEAMQSLYLELANNREERIVTEVEQLINLANQQLQLAGNISPALLALQNADTRLQELESPQATQLRKAIANDIQKLQSLPLLDITGMSIKLENIANSMNKLPLVSERTSKFIHKPANNPNLGKWQRFSQEVWQDIQSLVVLERIDRPEPPLIAPEQDFFLRETIKLRLLTARIALLQHDQTTYRRDLLAAEQWLKNHFDTRDAATKAALFAIHQLSGDKIVIQMPDISRSLALVSKYKLSLSRL